MRVESFDPARHGRESFDCGRPELNQWFKQAANQAARKGSSRTFVLTDDQGEVVGYYSLAAHGVAIDDVDPSLARGQLRNLPIPSVLLARLAVHRDFQGQGLGERLLADAVRRVAGAAEEIAIALLVIDAIDEDAAGFYQQYGFKRWPSTGLRLFARIRDITETSNH